MVTAENGYDAFTDFHFEFIGTALLQLICGDHCLAFSNQSTGLGEIRQAKKDDGRVYTAHSTRQSENFSTILG